MQDFEGNNDAQFWYWILKIIDILIMVFITRRKLKGFIHKWRIGKIVENEVKTRWEEDYELIANEGLFEEYLEMGENFISI